MQWLPEVPLHWQVKRVKRLVSSIEQGWSPQCENFAVDGEKEWGVLKVGCVNGGVFNPLENKKLPSELMPIRELRITEGDLLISRANTRELVGSAAVARKNYGNLLLCDKLYRLRLKNEQCLPYFLSYYLAIEEARSQIELAATGASSSMLNIGQAVILELPVPLPPFKEQSAIAAFLERETDKIDALIAEQEKLLALLAEKRQATISHAVTRGLSPDVPMKDSGVAWLGEMPAHWNVLRIKRVIASIEQGWSPQCENFPVENGHEWGVMKVGCVNGGVFNASENKKLPPELTPIPAYSLRKGDLLISRANTRELVGSSAVVPDDFENLLLCDKLYRLRTDLQLCKSDFLAAFLSVPAARAQIELEATGASSSMLNIAQSVILELSVPLPDKVEQSAIMEFISAETNKLNALEANAKRAIDLLKERRSALIAAAVTGKIDVRNAVPQELAA